jgi:hypothetical protein
VVPPGGGNGGKSGFKIFPVEGSCRMMKRGNVVDLFLLLLVLLTGLSLYFTFFRPIQFSHLIRREAVHHYGEVEILLPDDLFWMKEVLPLGEESHNVYGKLDWKILEIGKVTLAGKEIVKIKAKLLIEEESSGILRYGKYTIVSGNKIYLINDHYLLEGRILNFRLLEEKNLI